MKNYYQILGVSKSAHAIDIKRAYRKLALLYHPDRNPRPEAEQLFKEINEAYDILGDEKNRQWYDFKLQSTYQEVVQPAPTSRPTHRDPAYHRKRPRPQTSSTSADRRALIKQYLPYFSWLSWAGIILMVIMGLDYSLPLRRTSEEVIGVYMVQGSKRDVPTTVVVTTHNYKIYDTGNSLSFLEQGMQVDLEFTPILKSRFKISDKEHLNSASFSGIYGAVFIFPIALFIASSLGMYYRKDIETALNINITVGILFILVIFLMFTI